MTSKTREHICTKFDDTDSSSQPTRRQYDHQGQIMARARIVHTTETRTLSLWKKLSRLTASVCVLGGGRLTLAWATGRPNAARGEYFLRAILGVASRLGAAGAGVNFDDDPEAEVPIVGGFGGGEGYSRVVAGLGATISETDVLDDVSGSPLRTTSARGGVIYESDPMESGLESGSGGGNCTRDELAVGAAGNENLSWLVLRLS